MNYTKASPIDNWCLVKIFAQSENQNAKSFEERSFFCGTYFSIDFWVRFVICQKHRSSQEEHSFTWMFWKWKISCKGSVCLAALSPDLRLMTIALMGRRVNILGWIHVHCLVCIPTENVPTSHRVTDLTIQKVTHPVQANFLYFILTMDVLLFGKTGQLIGKGTAIVGPCSPAIDIRWSLVIRGGG